MSEKEEIITELKNEIVECKDIMENAKKQIKELKLCRIEMTIMQMNFQAKYSDEQLENEGFKRFKEPELFYWVNNGNGGVEKKFFPNIKRMRDKKITEFNQKSRIELLIGGYVEDLDKVRQLMESEPEIFEESFYIEDGKPIVDERGITYKHDEVLS